MNENEEKLLNGFRKLAATTQQTVLAQIMFAADIEENAHKRLQNGAAPNPAYIDRNPRPVATTLASEAIKG